MRTSTRPRQLTLADLPAGAGALVAIIGLVVLLGWVLNVHALEFMLPGGELMKANTAVCFTLMGAGLALVSRTPAGSRGRAAGLASWDSRRRSPC